MKAIAKKPTAIMVVILFSSSSPDNLVLKVEELLPPMVPYSPSLFVVCKSTQMMSPIAKMVSIASKKTINLKSPAFILR